MRNKDNKDATPGPDQELEQRIDEMMSLEQPTVDGPSPEADTTPVSAAPESTPPLDIFDSKTAPDVPPAVLKEAGLKSAKAHPEPAASEVPAANEAEPEATAYDDPKTDAAVDDIATTDSDKVLAAEDAQVMAPPPMKARRLNGLFKKWWFWLLVLLAVLGILYGVPFTRYKIAGFFITEPYSVTVLDSTTNLPVANATIKLDNQSATTSDQGVASLNVAVGHHMLTVHKQYYKDDSEDVLVSLPPTKPASGTVHLQATGRQVPVTVLNKITGKPIANAEVRVLDTKAVTGANGTAIIVLPTGKPTLSGKVDASSYNTTDVALQITDKIVPANTFRLTPSGRVYFLSNQSGKLDVVSTNLDGSDRQTVLAGTGNEDPHNTALVVSHDWKYLALLAKRDANESAKLYLIDTVNNNKLTTMDESNADFNLIGWEGNVFVYQLTRQSVQNWQNGRQSLMSYDAASHKSTTLDRTTASGDAGNWAGDNFGNIFLMNNGITYTVGWSSTYGGGLDNKQAELVNVHTDGTNKQVIKSFAPSAGSSPNYLILSTQLRSPATLLIDFWDGNTDHFYTYSNGQITTNDSLTQDNFWSPDTPQYYTSPDGNHALWVDVRDGKNALFVGDADGKNGKQIATLDDTYSAFGWYGNDYVLVSYQGNEMEILSAAGIDGGTVPLKVTGYTDTTNYAQMPWYGAGGGR